MESSASSPPSLESLSLHAFLELLESECRVLVTLVMRDSPYWRRTRRALADALREMVDRAVAGGQPGASREVRQKLFRGIISGKVSRGIKRFCKIYAQQQFLSLSLSTLLPTPATPTSPATLAPLPA